MSNRLCRCSSGILLLPGMLAMAACQRTAPVRDIVAVRSASAAEWDSVFAGRRIQLSIPGSPLTRIGQLAVGDDGRLYIPRGAGSATVLVLNGDGRFVREVDVGGDGPFASFGVFTTGPDRTLYVFHPQEQWVSVIGVDDGAVRSRFRIPSWPSAMLALDDGSLVVYSAGGETVRHRRDLLRGRSSAPGRVFMRFDVDGHRLAAAHRIEDDDLRIFHGRVHTGGVVRGPDSDIFGVHPARFELVRMTPSLDVREVLRAPDGPWTPRPPSFPLELDPFDYRPEHEAWWDGFVHIGAPFAITDDVLLVTLWKSRGLSPVSVHANVYRVGVEVVGEGLEVPHGGRIVGAGSGAVYVVRNARIQDDDTVQPLELYEYTLRSSARASTPPSARASAR